MDPTSIALKLLDLDKGKRDAVITSAVDDYLKILYTIASDIYDSCIADFYIKYTPKVYDRHGNVEGFNLYQANEITYNDLNLNVLIDENSLLPYGNEEDKREYVLSSVMRGLRGVGSSKLKGWPKHWRTSYPNSFSKQAGLWSSNKRTLNGILNDFIENAFKDTKNIFWATVLRKM